MHMADKLLLLLNVNPAGTKLGVSRDELCLQLGRNWEDLREQVGILRSFGWVNCGNRHNLLGEKTGEMEYWLTAVGSKELDRRKRQANPILANKTPLPDASKQSRAAIQLAAIDRLYGKGTKK